MDIPDQENWEELRNEARKIENSISIQLVSLTKLCAALSSDLQSTTQKMNHDEEPLLFETGINSSSEGFFSEPVNVSAADTAVFNLQTQIDQLQRINEKLVNIAQDRPYSLSSVARHNLQHHSDTLQDYLLEFRRLKLRLNTEKEHLSLLSGDRVGDERNANTGFLLREQQSLQDSNLLSSQLISQALETHDRVRFQRSAFLRWQSQMSQMTARFPAIGNLMRSIKQKKNRDTVVLGILVAVLFLFSLWYWIVR
eukprot:GCRY01002582.1.p1 GENE.GCRY01002582.1~~GCRY01002582.1.p1  ORF type:complete len:254 (-),score=39.82 GCRY01002582.1:147-908(-)